MLLGGVSQCTSRSADIRLSLDLHQMRSSTAKSISLKLTVSEACCFHKRGEIFIIHSFIELYWCGLPK